MKLHNEVQKGRLSFVSMDQMWQSKAQGHSLCYLKLWAGGKAELFTQCLKPVKRGLTTLPKDRKLPASDLTHI